MRHSQRTIYLLLTVLFVSISSSRSISQDASGAIAREIPPGVHTVQSGGFWTAGKEEGFFRVVVTAAGVEHVSHRLYIQWLTSDAKNHRYALSDTVNVKELNLGSGWLLETKTTFGNINAFKIDVTARGRDGRSRRFAISAMARGKYRIRSH